MMRRRQLVAGLAGVLAASGLRAPMVAPPVVFNLKSARSLQLKVPQRILLRTDEVID